MHSLSQPTGSSGDDAMRIRVRERWQHLFSELDVLQNISTINKSDREWLSDCYQALHTLDEVISLAKEQRRAVLESIRYEYPIDEEYIEEGQLALKSDSELLSEDAIIFGNYGIPQEDYFLGEFI